MTVYEPGTDTFRDEKCSLLLPVNGYMTMELQEALVQISAIRHQMARSERFRGYRATPVAFSGLLAFVAGGVQSVLIAEPQEHLGRYLTLWLTVASISMAVCFGDVWRRYRGSTARLNQETTHLAIEQFFPCLLAGGLLTAVVARSVPQVAWMLPGLWAILFSMGLFASWRLLPPATFGVASYYLMSGLCAISVGNGQYGLSPWTMPLVFGVGQLLTASVLAFSEKDLTGGAE